MIIDELRDKGIARLERVLWAEEFEVYLRGCTRWPGHVKARPAEGISCNAMADVMAAPHFLDYAKSFTPLASEYFGEPATMWSLNAFYTDKDTPYIPGVNSLHRDREARKILVLFMLGHDTTIDGAQLLVDERYDRAEVVYGPAGTSWLADTTHFHCGFLPSRPRMLAWARWAAPGLPQAFFDERLPAIP